LFSRRTTPILFDSFHGCTGVTALSSARAFSARMNSPGHPTASQSHSHAWPAGIQTTVTLTLEVVERTSLLGRYVRPIRPLETPTASPPFTRCAKMATKKARTARTTTMCAIILAIGSSGRRGVRVVKVTDVKDVTMQILTSHLKIRVVRDWSVWARCALMTAKHPTMVTAAGIATQHCPANNGRPPTLSLVTRRIRMDGFEIPNIRHLNSSTTVIRATAQIPRSGEMTATVPPSVSPATPQMARSVAS
jgi:hypothetical protein